ncbi:UPF0472 protein C16orf72 homolog [Galendromus occidentalis]|uniref:UPF0472 protein C16orf72 homolog n=1 Tax=Galendromus occidentalis TaxID=34638 RepID=A0AAJ7WHA7_9ACAR|nr:UPF0472 protein C16orf72 homolog [Galendromus occidentalis]XP_028966945.1 UPF0472 protein C16orf72 homolog [Galendromus occidentalis]
MSDQGDWRGLSRWEQECSDRVDESESTIGSQIAAERDAVAQRLFLLFQTSATSVAQLYKECQSGVRLWTSFQNAASSVTSLYKECVESQKRQQELAIQFGNHRRNKDILAWAHNRKRSIRREDLISFLSGRNPRLSPPTQTGRNGAQWGSPRRFDVQRGLTCLSLSAGVPSSGEATGAPHSSHGPIDDDDLGTFRQALALSAFTVGAASGAHHSSSPRTSKTADLSHFITEEFARHGRKRTLPLPSHGHHSVASASQDGLLRGSPTSDDVIMDSPQHKRPKYL